MAPTGFTPPGIGDAPADEMIFGHFRVMRRADGSLWEMGRGAMGITYRALDTSLGNEVALKIIPRQIFADDAARERFQREARAAAKVRHPNVASVLYLGEQAENFFCATELIAGRSLERLLADAGGSLPPAQALALAGQAAAALQAAHKRDAIHRNLKPANLLLLEGDAIDQEDARTEAAGHRQLKIIDFGLARAIHAGQPEDPLLTQSFAGFTGTPAYASPEQAAGAGDLDGRSDLYSLGVVLWQMLAGQLPFTGRVVEVLGKHQFQPPPLEQLTSAGVPPAMVEILAGLLVKNPAERRPQTAGELRAVLDNAAASPGSPAATATAVAAAAPSPDRGGAEAWPGNAVVAVPEIGAVLAARYRLEQEVARGNGGVLFLAADNAQAARPVALKLLSAARIAREPGFLERAGAALQKLRQHSHPVLLAPAAEGIQRADEGAFYVREWAAGFPLEALLTARNGRLAASEIFHLLDALPAALDFAADKALPVAETALRKLFVVPAEPGSGPSVGDDWRKLLAQPVAEWPAFALKFNPVHFPSNAAGAAPPDTAGYSAARAVVDLARLTRELLGSSGRGTGPIATLNGDANAVLRRATDFKAEANLSGFARPDRRAMTIRNPALGSESGDLRAGYPTATAYWQALQSAVATPAAAAAPGAGANRLGTIQPALEGFLKSPDALQPAGKYGKSPGDAKPRGAEDANPLAWPIETLTPRKEKDGSGGAAAAPLPFVPAGPKQRRRSKWPSLTASLALLAAGLLIGFSLALLAPDPRLFGPPVAPSTNSSPTASPSGVAGRVYPSLTPELQRRTDAAFAALKEHHPEEATKLFAALQREHPEWPSMAIESGRIHVYARQVDEAQESLTAAINRGLMPADANFLLGLMYMGLRDFVRAKEYYAQAVAIDPARAEFYFFWGECLRREGKPLEATSRFHSALLRNQYETADSLYRLKYWLSAIQGDQEASEGIDGQIETALAEQPHPPMEAFFAVAARALKAGQINEAVEQMRRGRAGVDPTVFLVVMQDPTFRQEIWRPELAEFFAKPDPKTANPFAATRAPAPADEPAATAPAIPANSAPPPDIK